MAYSVARPITTPVSRPTTTAPQLPQGLGIPSQWSAGSDNTATSTALVLIPRDRAPSNAPWSASSPVRTR